MNSKAIAAIVVVAALVIGGIFYLQNKSSDNASTSASPSASATPSLSPMPSSSASASASPVAASATIIYGESGFAVATTTVKSGTKVTFTNNSSSTVQLESDPHPAHTDNVELNVGSLAPGTSKTITVSKVGNWGMHNHLNPSMTTRVVVVQ